MKKVLLAILLLFGPWLLMSWVEEPAPLSTDFMDTPLQSPPVFEAGGTLSTEETQ